MEPDPSFTEHHSSRVFFKTPRSRTPRAGEGGAGPRSGHMTWPEGLEAPHFTGGCLQRGALHVCIFGCARSLLLHGLFSSCSKQGLLSSCDAQVSHGGGLSVVEPGL